MEDKIFDLMTKMYADLKGSQDKMYAEMKDQFESVNGKIESVNGKIESVNGRIDNLQNEVKALSNQVVRLENDLKPKVEAALDGYKQHAEILERIEKEVTRQEEIIMRRIK